MTTVARGSRPHVYRVAGDGYQGSGGGGLQVHEGHYRDRRMEDGLAHAVGCVHSPSVGVQMQDYVVRSLGLRVLQSETELAHGGVVDILPDLYYIDSIFALFFLGICRNG